MKNNVKILDCTLRDGGYFTNWDFDLSFVKDVVSSLNYSNVDIIEIGYKSPRKKNKSGFKGKFKYCNDSLLDFIPTNNKSSEYACMIDASDYVNDGKPDLELLNNTIIEKESSPIKWIRIASYYNNIPNCLPMLSILKDKGYSTTVNLMGMSLITDEDIMHTAKLLQSSPDIDCFYISDSFGNLTPSYISEILQKIKFEYSGRLGIHTHDNNGLAYANTICAIESGIDFIDSTIMGMGRGAGNLRTEQQLLYMVFKLGQSNKNPYELLDVIERWFVPMHKKYCWGWDFTYMLSAIQNIHPSYCMNLRSSNQYTIDQIKSIINEIPLGNRDKFNEVSLNEAIKAVIDKPKKSNVSFKELPLYVPRDDNNVLIIATGPSSQKYYSELKLFIQKNQPLVIECNPSDNKFSDITENYLAVILNEVRMNKALSNLKLSKLKIITGLTAISNELKSKHQIYSIPCIVTRNGVEIKKESISIPEYDVGMYAIAIAYLHNPELIFLTGFDGYKDSDNPHQQDMEKFLKNNYIRSKLVSITPTEYMVDIIPLYAYID